MKNLKVATKLIISFGAVIIMTIACSLVSVIGLKSVHGNVNLMIDTEIISLLRVKDVEIQVETIGRTVRAVCLRMTTMSKHSISMKRQPLPRP